MPSALTVASLFMAGLYIHVPFCKTRCAYCSFYSTTRQDLMEGYEAALLREMLSYPAGSAVETVYMGGGTPSQLGADRLMRILNAAHRHFCISPDAEITVEVNPDDVTPALTQALTAAGVNRVSMGVQSFCDEELQGINRRHTAAQATRAVEVLHQGGIRNISIDLMYGLPGQTLESFRRSIATALALPVAHISSYALSVEPDTPLHQRLEKGLFRETDDETMEQMYRTLCSELTQAGLEHYEISNFCRPGLHSRHNSSYWSGAAYIGLGPGACGYDGRATRRQNLPDLLAYLREATAPHTTEHLTDAELYNELILTRLRTAQGLDMAEVPPQFCDYLERMAAPHLAAGRLTREANQLRLSSTAIFVSDDIMSDLITT